MTEYLIDGNNLLHKIKELSVLQKKDPQQARERLAFMVDRHFISRNVKVFIFFDGFENFAIKTNKAKILYSGKDSADSRIRSHIEHSGNPKKIVAVSSDDEIKRIAKACSAATVNSEHFADLISARADQDEEEKRIREIDNKEFKKLFGIEDE